MRMRADPGSLYAMCCMMLIYEMSFQCTIVSMMNTVTACKTHKICHIRIPQSTFLYFSRSLNFQLWITRIWPSCLNVNTAWNVEWCCLGAEPGLLEFSILLFLTGTSAEVRVTNVTIFWQCGGGLWQSQHCPLCLNRRLYDFKTWTWIARCQRELEKGMAEKIYKRSMDSQIVPHQHFHKSPYNASVVGYCPKTW